MENDFWGYCVKSSRRSYLMLYLVSSGVLVHVLVTSLFIYFYQVDGFSPRQVFVKTLEHYDITDPLLVDLFSASPKFVNVPLDGEIKLSHPRIVLPQLANWNGQGVSPFIRDRISKYQASKHIYYQSMCGRTDLMSMTVCWLTTHDTNVLFKLSHQMQHFSLDKPTADTNYSNGWELALAYDLVFSQLEEADRKVIEKKIAVALEGSLSNLDESFSSLWHGRATHASIAWICASVLSDKYIENLPLLRQRAQTHFLTALDGLAYTEIWPSGYNYWIQSRALLFALASSAYVNGLENSKNKENVINIMRRVGYWHIYATRPDNRIEGFGDEGSRVDLKEETQRVIDLIVQMTRDPVLAGYSKYLSNLYETEGYYRHYRWGVLLFNDPSVSAAGDGTLASLSAFLKKAEIFGRNATNYIYLRSGWEPSDTFISFKAGHSFSHHAHYDAGHFTIFKGAPLVTNSSTYNRFFTEHRLNYAIRTIAKNSLLILKPHENVKPNRHFKNNVADGGQRLTLPTGSAILSVDDWLQNYKQGKHYEGAELLHFAVREDQFYYIDSDLTPAYNNAVFDENGANGKVKEVRRQIVYLPVEDQLIIYDKVISTEDSYIKKWLLHTANKPKVDNLFVLKGKANNGIFQSSASNAEIQNSGSFLKLKRFLPKNALTRLVGGRGYQYYVENDADESVFDGKNYHQGSLSAPWFDPSMWRLEIQARTPNKETEFLIALSPSVDRIPTAEVRRVKIASDAVYGLQTSESLVLFVKGFGQKQIALDVSGDIQRVIILAASIFDRATLRAENGIEMRRQAENGAIFFDLDKAISGHVQIRF